MKRLLDLDSPVFQFLTRVGELIILNLFFLLCSIPLVTAGASLAAMTKVTQNYSLDIEPGVTRAFFRAFRDNFRQATVAWLALVFVFAALAGDLLLIQTFLTGTTAFLLRGLTLFLALALLAVFSYLFPLLVRYDNTFRQHLQNAFLLAIGKLPRTLCVTVLNALPFVFLYLSPFRFLQTLSFWAIVGCAVLSYLDSILLAPVLRELERDPNAPPEDASGDEDEDA